MEESKNVNEELKSSSAAELSPAHVEAAEQLKKARMHNKFGSVCLEANRYEMAIKHFTKAIESCPENFAYSNALFNLGNTYAAMKETDKAIESYQRAICRSPFNYKLEDLSVKLEYGQSLRSSTSRKEAMEKYLAKKGEAQSEEEKKNNDEKAERFLRSMDKFLERLEASQGLNSVDTLVECHANLAVMYLMKGEVDNSHNCCRIAIELQPEMSEAHINLGNILRQLGSKQQAIQHVWDQVKYAASQDGIEFSAPHSLKLSDPEMSTEQEVTHITVVCVKWGTKYGPDYVNKLYHGVKKYLSVSFNFVCFTEDSSGLEEGIETKELDDSWKGWWGKATLFGQATGLTGRIMFLDLDSIICGSLDDMAKYRGPFALLGTGDIYCEKAKNGYNSSIILWDANIGRPIFEVLNQYRQYIHRYIVRFDHWLEMMVQECDLVQDVFPQQFADFTSFCKDTVPEGTRIVGFPREPKPHDYPAEWIRDLWV